jgi:hypothetical protein
MKTVFKIVAIIGIIILVGYVLWNMLWSNFASNFNLGGNGQLLANP